MEALLKGKLKIVRYNMRILSVFGIKIRYA